MEAVDLNLLGFFEHLKFTATSEPLIFSFLMTHIFSYAYIGIGVEPFSDVKPALEIL